MSAIVGPACIWASGLALLFQCACWRSRGIVTRISILLNVVTFALSIGPVVLALPAVRQAALECGAMSNTTSFDRPLAFDLVRFLTSGKWDVEMAKQKRALNPETREYAPAAPGRPEPLQLDVYAAKRRPGKPHGQAAVPPPTLVFFHGGAFVYGDRTQALLPFGYFVHRGVNVVSVDYQLIIGGATAARYWEDLRALCGWLGGAEASELGIDRRQLVFVGESAGSYLAVLAAAALPLRRDFSRPPSRGLPLRAAGVVNFYGVTEMEFYTEPEYERWRVVRKLSPWLIRKLLGPPGDATDWRALVREHASANVSKREHSFNPIAWLSSQSPPILTFHGTADVLVPPEASRRLHERLSAFGVPNWLFWVSGASHGFNCGENVGQQLCLYCIERFVRWAGDRAMAASSD